MFWDGYCCWDSNEVVEVELVLVLVVVVVVLVYDPHYYLPEG